jgi:hypothetical protein
LINHPSKVKKLDVFPETETAFLLGRDPVRSLSTNSRYRANTRSVSGLFISGKTQYPRGNSNGDGNRQQ